MRYHTNVKEVAKTAGLGALKARLGSTGVLLSLAELARSAPARSPKTMTLGAPSTSGPRAGPHLLEEDDVWAVWQAGAPKKCVSQRSSQVVVGEGGYGVEMKPRKEKPVWVNTSWPDTGP